MVRDSDRTYTITAGDAVHDIALPEDSCKKVKKVSDDSTSTLPDLLLPVEDLSVRALDLVGAVAEEAHWHEVFQDFVRIRTQCGEGSDGLTFEKFKAKLVKNKEQLVQKYSCKSVRFQVYVKDGKAALKATPVRA